MPHTVSFDLSNKVYILSGGGGILGRRFVAALVSHGARVSIIDSDNDRLDKLREETASRGDQIEILHGDITQSADWQRFLDTTLNRFGRINGLVNNAAAKSKNFFAPFSDFPLSDWNEVMAVNLTGAMLGCQTVGAYLAENGGGSIVNILSIYGVAGPDQRIYEGSIYEGRPINTPAVYSASKAGLWGLTMYLSSYWADRNVRVNAVSPGGVFSGQNDTFVSRYSSRTPMGRMANDDEMSGGLLYFLSDASSYCTGQNLVIDGGLTVW